MSNKYVDFDVGELREFVGRLKSAASGDFKRAASQFLEDVGFDFLRILADEIVRRDVTDSRLLLASFRKGSEHNIWELSEGDLTLEVGTNIEYAAYVNDGHWTNKKGVKARWVPGYWEGKRFIYDKDAKTGMLLKQKWIEGKHYWESALRILDKILPKYLDKKLQKWLDDYFKM